MTRTTDPRTVRTARTVRTGRTGRTTFVAVSASLGFLLSACGADPSDVGSGSPITTVVAVADAGPTVIRVAPGGWSSAAPGGGATGEAAPAADAMTRLAWMEFVLGIDLPALDGDSPAWRIDADVDPAQVAAIAAALGLTGDPAEQPADWGGGWIVGPNDGSGPSLTVSADGLGSWWYSGGPMAGGWACAEPAVVSDGTGAEGEDIVVEPAPDGRGTCEVPEPPANVPSGEEAETLMRDLLVAWGVDPTTVEMDNYADQWGANVTAYLLLDGQRSPIAWGASFGGDGELLYANGVLGTPEQVADYPRIGAAAGFERLQDGSTWFGGGGFGVADSAVVRGAATPSDAAEGGPLAVDPAVDVMPGAPEPGSAIQVTITGVEEELWMVWDADGVVWLVPGYTFVADDGGRYSVPAIPDDLIELPPAPEPVPLPEPLPVDSLPVDTPVDPPVLEEGAELPVEGGIGSLIGLPEEEAVQVVEGAGWTTRVVARDGEQFAVTMDYRMDRVNLEIVDGVVTGATIG